MLKKITLICSWAKNLKQKGDGVIKKKYHRLSEPSKTLKIDHLESRIKENIKKMICRYQEVFTLPSDLLPCTNLTEHEIILNSGKIINLRTYKLPEKTKRMLLETDKQVTPKGNNQTF